MSFFSRVRVKPRYQNLRQDGESSGTHAIARQLACRTGSPSWSVRSKIFWAKRCGSSGE
jgi:hypothetical protein